MASIYGCRNPATPTLVAPPDGSTGLTVTGLLDWSDVPNGTGFDVYVYCGSGGSAIASATDIASEFAYDLPAGDYSWRVRSHNACGTSALSARWYFTIGAGSLCAVPVLQSPANETTCVPTSGALTWDPIPGATGYILQYTTVRTGRDIVRRDQTFPLPPTRTRSRILTGTALTIGASGRLHLCAVFRMLRLQDRAGSRSTSAGVSSRPPTALMINRLLAPWRGELRTTLADIGCNLVSPVQRGVRTRWPVLRSITQVWTRTRDTLACAIPGHVWAVVRLFRLPLLYDGSADRVQPHVLRHGDDPRSWTTRRCPAGLRRKRRRTRSHRRSLPG